MEKFINYINTLALLIISLLSGYILFYLLFPFKVVVSDEPILKKTWLQEKQIIVTVKQPFSLKSNVFIDGYPAYKHGEALLVKLEMDLSEDNRMIVTRAIFCDDHSYIPMTPVDKVNPKGNYWGENYVISDHNIIPGNIPLNTPCHLRFDTQFVVHPLLRKVPSVVQTEKFVIYE